MESACSSGSRSRWSILLTSEKLNEGESHTYLTTHSGRRAHRRTSRLAYAMNLICVWNVIITVGETSLGDYSKEAGSRLSLAAFSFGANMHRLRGHTQKPPRSPSTARAVAFA
jgi:hypothetical protein